MPNFMLLSRCENLWPFLTLRALTTGPLHGAKCPTKLMPLVYQCNSNTTTAQTLLPNMRHVRGYMRHLQNETND